MNCETKVKLQTTFFLVIMASNFPGYILAEFEDAFHLYAKDERIGWSDLKQIIKILEGAAYDDKALKDSFEKVDADADGLITFDEFVEIIAHKLHQMTTPDEIKQAFEAFDINGTGMVSSEHIRKALVALGNDVTETEVNDLMSEFTDKQAISYNDNIRSYETDLMQFKSATNI